MRDRVLPVGGGLVAPGQRRVHARVLVADRSADLCAPTAGRRARRGRAERLAEHHDNEFEG